MRRAAIPVLMLAAASCGRDPGAMPADAGATIVLDAGAESGADSSPWSLVPLPGDPAVIDRVELRDMGAAGSDLYVVGSIGTILRSTDQGGSWSAVGLTPGGPNGL